MRLGGTVALTAIGMAGAGVGWVSVSTTMWWMGFQRPVLPADYDKSPKTPPS
jgi:hypothetical protein